MRWTRLATGTALALLASTSAPSASAQPSEAPVSPPPAPSTTTTTTTTVTTTSASAAPPASPAVPMRKVDLRDEPERWPTLRFGMGLGLYPHGKSAVSSAFDFDINLGTRLGLTPLFGIWPEFGYSSSTNAVYGGKYFAAGIGPIFGTPMAAVGWSPKVILGDQGGAFGLGMRNAIVGSFVYDLLSAEIAHQWVHTATGDIHEARALIAIDVVPIAAYFFFTGLMSSISRR